MMGRKDYRSVSVPRPLIESAEHYIENYEIGYTSVPELIRSLLRNWIKDTETKIDSQKAAEPLMDAFELANKGKFKEAGEKLRELR